MTIDEIMITSQPDCLFMLTSQDLVSIKFKVSLQSEEAVGDGSGRFDVAQSDLCQMSLVFAKKSAIHRVINEKNDEETSVLFTFDRLKRIARRFVKLKQKSDGCVLLLALLSCPSTTNRLTFG